MIWFAIETLNRGRLEPPARLDPDDEVKADQSLEQEKALGVREWTERWDEVNSFEESVSFGILLTAEARRP